MLGVDVSGSGNGGDRCGRRVEGLEGRGFI